MLVEGSVPNSGACRPAAPGKPELTLCGRGVRLIINNNVDPLFPQKLFSQAAVREAALVKYGDKQDPAEREYRFHFIAYGAYRVICVWLNKDDREPPQQIARQLIRFIQME